MYARLFTVIQNFSKIKGRTIDVNSKDKERGNMIRFGNFMKRVLVMLLSVALVSNSTDMTVFAMAAETEETSLNEAEVTAKSDINIGTGDGAEVIVAENRNATGNVEDEVIVSEEIWIDLGDTYTTAPSKKTPGISIFSLENGTVDLIDGTAVDWIDRIDLSGDAAVIRTFYDTLVEATDNDGVDDQLIEDSYFASDYSIKVAEVTGVVANEEEFNTIGSTILAKYSPYVRAAFDAFDRDHPEVFWLSGSTSCGGGTRGSYNGDGSLNYTFTLNFLVKSNTFDIRDSKYQSESAIKTAIAARDSKVTALVNAAEGKSTAKKIDYFNDQLTTTNQYNTSQNLNAIEHDCRECVSALEGRTGTVGPVCEAYARAFKVLCDKAGIPCVLVDGEAKNSLDDPGTGHMWNYVQVDDRWFGMDVTWNDPSVTGAAGAVSGYEGDNWSLVGSQTYPGNASMKFIESHPVSNTVSYEGIGFTNGPEIEEQKYVEGVGKYGVEVTSGTCGASGSSVNWAVYDSGTDNNPAVTTPDTLVISGNGAMADYESQTDRPWQSYASSIVKVIVEDGVTTVGDYAFAYMGNVTDITIPDNITSIGMYAFISMLNAEGLYIPSAVTTIGEAAFMNCPTLTGVEIPSGLTQIAFWAFADCTGLTDITIPATVTSISEAAFDGCSNLTTVYIPKRETPIEGTYAFITSEIEGITANATVYFESTPITEFEGVTLKAPYTISYKKNDVATKIAEVYADNLQNYTIGQSDLPATIGTWLVNNYNNSGRKYIEVGTVLDNISSDVVIDLIPMKITGQPQAAEVTYGYTTAPTLSVTVEKDGDVEVGYQWYRRYSGGIAVMDGATTATMTLPIGLDAGEYTYTCAVYYGEYTIYSDEVIVTVHPTGLANATVNVSGTYTYDGTEKVPVAADVTVTLYGETVPTDDYEITGASNNINAGRATVTITAKPGTNYTGSATGTFTISPMEIEVIDAEFAAKSYDGNTNAEVTSVSFAKANTEEAISLVKDTDYTVTASYNDANVGTDKVITVNVALVNTAASNYTLVTSEGVFENQVIVKAPALTVDAVTKKYVYSKSHEVSLNLDTLLPDLENDKSFGTVSYQASIATGELLEGDPTVEGNMLGYTIMEGEEGATGSIAITVNSQNYDSFTITLNLVLVDQIEVVLQEGSKVSLSDNTLTYGQAVSVLTFDEAVFVEEGKDTVVEGTLDWVNPEQILTAGTHNVAWIFTPNSDEYMTVEGKIEVVVEKADCVVETVGTLDGYNVLYTYDGESIPTPSADAFTHTNTDGDATIKFAWYQGDCTDVQSLADGDKLAGAPVDAGVYTLVVTVGETPNYNAADLRIKVEIAKKAITITAENKERKYGEENPEFTFVVPEGTLVGSDTKEDLGVALSTEATVDSNVGTYPITGVADSKNYEVTVIPAMLTILQADGYLAIPEGKSTYVKNYGDVPFAIETDTNSEGTLVYTVSEGKNLEGEPKAESDILVIDENGIATINGSGTVTVQIELLESLNHTAAAPVAVTVRVNRVSEFVVQDIPDQTYTGKALRPEPKVFDGESEKLLVKGKDYTISYKNNTNASVNTTDTTKLPIITIKGKGNYSKQISVNFVILPKDISEEEVSAPDIFLLTNGSVQKKAPVLTYNKKKLKANKDMIVTYPDTGEGAYQVDGEYTIHVEGQGNYTGDRDIAITLKDKGYLINKVGIKKIPAQNFADYGGEVILDADTLVVTSKINGENVTLEEGVDFEAHYENNDKVGTASVTIVGINEFRGTKKATFKINGISIAKATVEGIENQVYNGNAFEPEVTVTLPGGEELFGEDDYTVEYVKNTNVGTATVTIKGTGAYSGTIKKKFKITAYDFTGETNANGNVKEDTLLTETGGLFEMADGELHAKFVKGGSKPEVELQFDGKVLTQGKDYTVSYANNKAVTKDGVTKLPTITIKGKGNFKGAIAKVFTIDAKDLDDEVTFTVNDMAANGKEGGYISKPVLTDADGKKLSAGKDYTNPVYTLGGEPLDKTSIVEAGKVITVTVCGMGNYTDKEITATYRITELNFTAIKAAAITKIYNGSEVELTKSDFYNEDGTSKITLQDGTMLEYGEDKDFVIVEGSYKKNDKKGTATVTLKGCGKYGGAKTIKFKIVSKELKK